ncbi:30S ribosome-binding factor RbfA [bacterium]|jgi:ribosome-binding factor A|nr:30S ribosome-binding factor RbfA [bacterium]
MRRQVSHKRERIQSDIYRGVSELISRDINDERVRKASPILQEVALNRDGSLAKIYISFLREELSENDKKEVMRILQKSAGYFRSCLAKIIKARSVPRLDFYYDSWKEEMNLVDEVLRKEGEELKAILGPESNDDSTPSPELEPTGDDPEVEEPS